MPYLKFFFDIEDLRLFLENWRKGIKVGLVICDCKNYMAKLFCPSLSYQHLLEEPESVDDDNFMGRVKLAI